MQTKFRTYMRGGERERERKNAIKQRLVFYECDASSIVMVLVPPD